MEGLRQPQMIDDDSRLGMVRGELGQRRQLVPAQHVHRQVVLAGAGEDTVQPRLRGAGFDHGKALGQHDASAHCAGRVRPLGNLLRHIDGRGVERLDQAESRWMPGMHLAGVAAVVAVHAERGNQEGAIDANGIHGRHHVVARHLRRPNERSGPRPFGTVALVGVNLAVDDRCRGAGHGG